MKGGFLAMAEPDRRSPNAESTVSLCARIREGDAHARDILVERYFAALSRWARGRLPRYARSEMNTEDLVQNTMVRALGRLEGFKPGETGSFLAYLRTILKNQIRDQVRTTIRRPPSDELDEEIEEVGPSPMDEAIDAENWERYEKALAELPEQQREGVIMRLELQFSHQQVADALGMRTANGARMMVSRAIEKLVQIMGQGSGSD